MADLFDQLAKDRLARGLALVDPALGQLPAARRPLGVRQVGAAGRAYVEGHHTWGATAERLESVYRLAGESVEEELDEH